MTLRSKLQLSSPLAEISRWLYDALPEKRSWEILFCLDGADDCFSTAVRRRARDYLRLFYDLDQMPRGRPRREMIKLSKAGSSLSK